MAIGHLGSIYLAALVAFTAQLLNARAPQLLGIYISCSVVQSLTQGWMLVIASPLMMRVCRSYALEPKMFAETIFSALWASFCLSFVVFGPIGGAFISAIGFRDWTLVTAIIILFVVPAATYIGFHPKVMGVELAPMPVEGETATTHKQAPLPKG